MSNRPFLRAFPLLFLLACLGFASQLLGSSAQETIRILPNGVPIEVSHSVDETAPMFRIKVPRHATTMHIWSEGTNVDLGLLLSFDEQPDPDLHTGGVVSENTWVDEEVWVHVTDFYNLSPGDWFVTLPISTDLDREDYPERVEYSLHCEVFTPERTELQLLKPVTVKVKRSEGLLAAFNCDVGPELASGSTALRLEVLSTDADVDILVGPRGADSTYWDSFAIGNSSLGYERLHFNAKEAGRRFGVFAYALPSLEPFEELEFTVLLTLDDENAPTICPAPDVPAMVESNPLARALHATVAVFGTRGSGSGIVVSEKGHVLTNAHVVSGSDRSSTEFSPLSIAFNTDHRRSAVPSLGARILAYSEQLDLALLQIDGDLIGRPLPEELRFPHVELRPADDLPRIGEELWCAGYPMTGGSGFFVSLTVTRGVLSGYSREPEGIQYKVDADIHSGMSGGACFDTAGLLIGLPSASLTDFNNAG
ncbi:MAG: S1-C subfamily serine protease, partial [Planctomycetota bacterium]